MISFLNHEKIKLENFKKYEEIVIDIEEIKLFPITYLEELDKTITNVIKNSEVGYNRPVLITFLGNFEEHEPSEETIPFMELVTNLAFYACSTSEAAKRERRLSPPEKMVRKLVGIAALKRYINNQPLYKYINIRFIDKISNELFEVVFDENFNSNPN